MRILPGYFNSIEAINLGQPNVLRNIAHLGSDMLKRLIKIEGGRVMKIGERLDEVDPFPSVDDSEFRAFSGQNGR